MIEETTEKPDLWERAESFCHASTVENLIVAHIDLVAEFSAQYNKELLARLERAEAACRYVLEASSPDYVTAKKYERAMSMIWNKVAALSGNEVEVGAIPSGYTRRGPLRNEEFKLIKLIYFQFS